jgi:ParB-like chromosome segregation protein Spo0J
MTKLVLPLDRLVPIRQLKDAERENPKYRSIVASIRNVGIVEPLVVFRGRSAPEEFSILDGNVQFCALREIGAVEVECLIALENESFTYNAKVNRLLPIQEHAMIKKAVENGVPEERIATVLKLQVRTIVSSLRLLDGIDSEAVRILKDKPICRYALRALRKVCPIRQMEIAELMKSANNFTRAYAEALVIGTPREQLKVARKPRQKLFSPREIVRMENEISRLEKDFKSVELTYGDNTIRLCVLERFASTLLGNDKIRSYVQCRHPEIFVAFESIASHRPDYQVSGSGFCSEGTKPADALAPET